MAKSRFVTPIQEMLTPQGMENKMGLESRQKEKVKVLNSMKLWESGDKVGRERFENSKIVINLQRKAYIVIRILLEDDNKENDVEVNLAKKDGFA